MPERPAPGFTARDALLLHWLADGDASALELTPRRIEALGAAAGDAPPLPDAFAVVATLLAAGEDAVAAGRFRVGLTAAGGPSGANLLARFGRADRRLAALVRGHLRAEEALRPDALFAEIIHLPEGGIGNVLLRPRLRRHEIPYLGRASARGEARIAVGDLTVSVVGERVVLRSRRLEREVVPRLTAAHNFAHPANLAVYRFLCALQGQGVHGRLAFSFGALDVAAHLPRVTRGRLVLAPERWNLSADELAPLGDPDEALGFRATQTLRERRRLPRWIAIAETDNLLPVDLDNAISVAMAGRRLRRRARATLVELFLGPDDLVLHGPEGRFAHQLVVPFVRARSSVPASAPVRRPVARPADRTAAPGSPWLYAKLYTSVSATDALLASVARPVVAVARAHGSADGWFFARYGDPDWHLRLRLHGDPRALLRDVMPQLCAAAAPALADGRVRRLAFDTYERELERYGGPDGMALSERLFTADSDAALELIGLTPGDGGADARWRVTLLGIDRLLDDLGLDLGVRRGVLAATRTGSAPSSGSVLPSQRRSRGASARSATSSGACWSRSRPSCPTASPRASPSTTAAAWRWRRLPPACALPSAPGASNGRSPPSRAATSTCTSTASWELPRRPRSSCSRTSSAGSTRAGWRAGAAQSHHAPGRRRCRSRRRGRGRRIADAGTARTTTVAPAPASRGCGRGRGRRPRARRDRTGTPP